MKFDKAFDYCRSTFDWISGRSSSKSNKKNAVIEKENLVVNVVSQPHLCSAVGGHCDDSGGCSNGSINCSKKNCKQQQRTGNRLAASNSTNSSSSGTTSNNNNNENCFNNNNGNKNCSIRTTKTSIKAENLSTKVNKGCCCSSTTNNKMDIFKSTAKCFKSCCKDHSCCCDENPRNSSNACCDHHEQLSQLDSNGSGNCNNICVCESIANDEFKRITAAPVGVDEREWIASHLLAFFHHINALYGSVSEYCTPENCPVMNGKDAPQILWIDERGRKCKYSAQQYIDCVMSFVEKIVDSEEAFPTKFGTNFPSNFDQSASKIFRLLYNVLNHLNATHSTHLNSVNLHHQVRTLTLHFVTFCKRYDESLDAKTLQHLNEIEQNFINLPNPYCHNNNNNNNNNNSRADNNNRMDTGQGSSTNNNNNNDNNNNNAIMEKSKK